ncbi:MAG: hypothetical protein IPM24_24660 [Bryobacterales bacterium]|nr:hypothetical protein [Bryobacterales bacterium]
MGSGKSAALCHEAVRLTYQNPGRMGLLGAPTYPMLRDATQAALFEILNANRLPYEFHKAENVLVMKDTGSKVVFRPVDDFERLRGTNLAWFGLDELTYTAEQAWMRLEARLRDAGAQRLCGFGVWTPRGFDWVYERFIREPRPGYEAVLARPYENTYLLKQVPDFYDRLKTSYDTRFYAQEALGEYLSLSGNRVYEGFERTVHMKNLERNPTATLLWALDFNVDPMCSVVAQMERGTVLVLDEIVLRRATTREACEEFVRRFGKHAGGLRVYGDASGNNQQTTGSSDFEIVRDFFRGRGIAVEYRIPRKNPDVRQRVNAMAGKLRNADGDVALWVDARCKELVQDFEQVTYKEHTTVIDKERDRRRTHLSDALGYLVWQECQPVAAIGEKAQRLF